LPGGRRQSRFRTAWTHRGPSLEVPAGRYQFVVNVWDSVSVPVRASENHDD
jgi:hypothetical protein